MLKNGERNLYSWPFIQSNSACQLELHQITETQVMATCPETQFFFFIFWVEIGVLKCDLIKSPDPHAPMTVSARLVYVLLIREWVTPIIY